VATQMETKDTYESVMLFAFFK